MDDTLPRPVPPRLPSLTPDALARQAEREARQAAALRDNLRRRKQQARARQDADAAPDLPDPSCLG